MAFEASPPARARRAEKAKDAKQAPADDFAAEVARQLGGGMSLTRDGAMLGRPQEPLQAAPRAGLMDKLVGALRGKKEAGPPADEATLLSEVAALAPLDRPERLQALLLLRDRLEALTAALVAAGRPAAT